MNKFQKFKLRNVPIKNWFNPIAITIQILKTKSSCAHNQTKETIKRINFDSDGMSFVMDNSVNCQMHSDKSHFVDLNLSTKM